MEKYIHLAKYRDGGIARLRAASGRLDELEAIYRQHGATLSQWYWSFGRYDAVYVSDVPDGETMARLVLAVNSLGNVATETMRIFSAQESWNLLNSAPQLAGRQDEKK